MDIRGQVVVEEFKRKHARSRRPLDSWKKVTENAVWKSFLEIRDTFNSADSCTKDDVTYVIFDIAGNKYRLITEIDYAGTLAVVALVMTHAEYSKDRWKDKL